MTLQAENSHTHSSIGKTGIDMVGYQDKRNFGVGTKTIITPGQTFDGFMAAGKAAAQGAQQFLADHIAGTLARP